MKKIFSISYIFLLIVLITACKKDEAIIDTEEKTGKLSLEFDPRFGDKAFDFDVVYTLNNGENLKFSEFKYFISNIELLKDGQVAYTVPKEESYFLISNKKVDSRKIQLSDIPVDDYTEIRFIVGVDSLMNATDVSSRPSALDVAGTAEGMYWAWNSGYIFLKAEGTCISCAEGGKPLQYHIGGFGGYNTPTINNIRQVSISRPNNAPIQVLSTKVSDAHILVDLKKMFENPTEISVASHSTVMLNEFSKTVADNYATMFTLDHVH